MVLVNGPFPDGDLVIHKLPVAVELVVVIDFGPGRVERRAVELLAPRGKWRVGGDGWFGG